VCVLYVCVVLGGCCVCVLCVGVCVCVSVGGCGVLCVWVCVCCVSEYVCVCRLLTTFKCRYTL